MSVKTADEDLGRQSAIFALYFFFQAQDGIRDLIVTGVQTCALPISLPLPQQPDAARPQEVDLVRGQPGPVDDGAVPERLYFEVAAEVDDVGGRKARGREGLELGVEARIRRGGAHAGAPGGRGGARLLEHPPCQ